MEKDDVVNANYDLSTCTEDIIGIIGLGQRFGMQQVAEPHNTDNADRAFMLKRAMISTALGPVTKCTLHDQHCTRTRH